MGGVSAGSAPIPEIAWIFDKRKQQLMLGVGGTPNRPQTSPHSEMSTRTEHLEIDGMHCQHCVEAVREALESVRGLSVERVEIGTAEVTYESDTVTTEQLATVLDDVGYDLASA